MSVVILVDPPAPRSFFRQRVASTSHRVGIGALAHALLRLLSHCPCHIGRPCPDRPPGVRVRFRWPARLQRPMRQQLENILSYHVSGQPDTWLLVEPDRHQGYGRRHLDRAPGVAQQRGPPAQHSRHREPDPRTHRSQRLVRWSTVARIVSARLCRRHSRLPGCCLPLMSPPPSCGSSEHARSPVRYLTPELDTLECVRPALFLWWWKDADPD